MNFCSSLLSSHVHARCLVCACVLVCDCCCCRRRCPRSALHSRSSSLFFVVFAVVCACRLFLSFALLINCSSHREHTRTIATHTDRRTHRRQKERLSQRDRHTHAHTHAHTRPQKQLDRLITLKRSSERERRVTGREGHERRRTAAGVGVGSSGSSIAAQQKREKRKRGKREKERQDRERERDRQQQQPLTRSRSHMPCHAGPRACAQ